MGDVLHEGQVRSQGSGADSLASPLIVAEVHGGYFRILLESGVAGREATPDNRHPPVKELTDPLDLRERGERQAD